jgi:hypothetical protein
VCILLASEVSVLGFAAVASAACCTLVLLVVTQKVNARRVLYTANVAVAATLSYHDRRVGMHACMHVLVHLLGVRTLDDAAFW